MSCLTPITIKNVKTGKYIEVSCGKCANCITLKRMQWSFRFREESENSYTTKFITLTYDDEHIELINKRAVQLFIKRFRKNGYKIKYFAVGEYGSHTQRPHYHLLLFFQKPYLSDVKLQRDVEEIWQNGNVSVLPAELGSLMYVTKDLFKAQKVITDDDNQFLNCFHLQSQGLGSNYINKNKDFHYSELSDLYDRNFICFDNGVKIGMPRYYKNKIYGNVPKGIKEMVNKKLSDKYKDKTDYDEILKKNPLFFKEKQEAIEHKKEILIKRSKNKFTI